LEGCAVVENKLNSESDSFDNYYNGFYKELSKLDELGNTFKKIEKFLPELSGGETIIDIGCGHGGVSAELVTLGYEVTGVEINSDAIKSLRKKGFKVIKKNISHPLEINEKFDIILILDVLEHLFDPYSLLVEVKKIANAGSTIIVTVPLYFDFIDRLKILFTGSVISMDNLCYGQENYKMFRSYNYDHIRFFRPDDIYEMGEKLNFKTDKVSFGAASYGGKSVIFKILTRIISNKYTVNLNPNLLAHSMKIRWKME
jgi:2-polyprenyl-3-methyl-5-hydroxy-6-metoxy-1,4-benzoquinol methylase